MAKEIADLLYEFNTRADITIESLADLISDIAVPVVRCKDCKWYNPKGDDSYFLFDFWCDNDDGMWNPSPESYCSFGERREEKND